MKKRYWCAYFRQITRTSARVDKLIERWGSTGYQDPCAPPAVAAFWKEWFAVGDAVATGSPATRSLFRRLRLLDKQARNLPAAHFGI